MVANVYHAQPLIDVTADGTDLDQAVGALASVRGIGYVFGLLLIVPLGDTRGQTPAPALAARPCWALR